MPPPPAVAGARQRLVVWGVMMLALLAVGAWWWLAQSSGPNRSTAPSGPVAQANAPSAVGHRPVGAAGLSTVSLPTSVQPPVPASGSPGEPVSEAERLRLSLERLALEDRLHTAELAEQRKARALERQRAEQQRLEQARRRAEVAAVVPATEEPRVSAPPVGVAKTETPPVRPAPEPVQTVELACSGSSNFFTRDLCRIRECSKPAFASDQTCVRFRQMEEANRRTLAQ